MTVAAPLSAIETERLRDMRSRLSRRATSEAAQGALGNACLQLCGQVGLGGAAPYAVESLSVAGLVKAAAGADMAMLARLVATLKDYKDKQPKAWPAVVAAGAPQALLSRRLALAGREPPVETPSETQA